MLNNEEIIEKIKKYKSMGINVYIIPETSDNGPGSALDHQYEESRLNNIKNKYFRYLYRKGTDSEYEDYLDLKNRIVGLSNINEELALFVFKDTSNKQLTDLIETMDFAIDLWQEYHTETGIFDDLYGEFYEDVSLISKQKNLNREKRNSSKENPWFPYKIVSPIDGSIREVKVDFPRENDSKKEDDAFFEEYHGWSTGLDHTEKPEEPELAVDVDGSNIGYLDRINFDTLRGQKNKQEKNSKQDEEAFLPLQEMIDDSIQDISENDEKPIDSLEIDKNEDQTIEDTVNTYVGKGRKRNYHMEPYQYIYNKSNYLI